MSLLFALAAAAAVANPTPGVEEVSPGVRRIDGSKVESQQVSGEAIKAAIAKDPSFKTLRKMLGGKGIENVGPGGTITHMYKVHDTDSDEAKVLILFVHKGKVVEYLLT